MLFNRLLKRRALPVNYSCSFLRHDLGSPIHWSLFAKNKFNKHDMQIPFVFVLFGYR